MSLSEADLETVISSQCTLVKDCIEQHTARLGLTLKNLVQVCCTDEDREEEERREHEESCRDHVALARQWSVRVSAAFRARCLVLYTRFPPQRSWKRREKGAAPRESRVWGEMRAPKTGKAT